MTIILFIALLLSPWWFGLKATIVIGVLFLACLIGHMMLAMQAMSIQDRNRCWERDDPIPRWGRENRW